MPSPISHSYYVVMIDYGRRGLEAVVDPEMTRRAVVERIQSREYDRVAFIHHIEGGAISDVTGDLFAEAGRELEAA